MNFKAVGEIAKITSITIPKGLKVDYQQDGSNQAYYRDPQKIDNDGTESVTVTLKGTTATTTITIDSNDVTANKVWEYSAGFSTSDELEFTFSDKYYRGSYQWSDNVTYTATCTVGEMLSGNVTLYFTHPKE